MTQTKDHVLRVKYKGLCTEAPLGSYVIVPERKLSNMFSIGYREFEPASEQLGGLQYRLSLENLRILFYQDYEQESLETLLKAIDEHALVELDKQRAYCSGRFIAITYGHVVVIGQDFVFTLEDSFCRALAQSNKIVYRDKRVVVNDASVVLIKTDAVVIVDSQRKCSIWKKDLANVNEETEIQNDWGTKELLTKVNESKYKFSIYNQEEANRVSITFIRDHQAAIGVEMSLDNQKMILKYVLDAMSGMIRKGNISTQNKLVTHLRINTFTFDAVYSIKEQQIALVQCKR